MANKTIPAKVGIFDANYRIINHKDGAVTVRAPRLHQSSNSSTVIKYKKYKIVELYLTEMVKKFFDANAISLPANNMTGTVTLDDILDDRIYPGVHLS